MSAPEKWKAMGIERCPSCHAPRAWIEVARGCGCAIAVCRCTSERRTSPRLFVDGGCAGCVVVRLAVRMRAAVAANDLREARDSSDDC